MRAPALLLLAITPPALGMIGPSWTYDEAKEAPLGEKSMGTWTAAVYTPEQQARLGVTEMGDAVVAPTPPDERPAWALSGWDVVEGERCYGGLPTQPGLVHEAMVASIEACAALADEVQVGNNAFTWCEACLVEQWGQNCWLWSLPADRNYVEGETWCDTPGDYHGFTTGHRVGTRGILAHLAARARAFFA